MTSDTEDIQHDSKQEWEHAEQALDRLIAAHHNLLRAGARADTRASQTETVPASAAVVQLPAAIPAAPSALSRWPTVILLSALSLSAALVVSAAIIAVAKLL